MCLSARARDCPHHFGRRLVGSRSQTWGTARDAIELTRHTFSHKSSWSINHHRSMRAHCAPGTVEGMGVKPEGRGFTDIKDTPHRAHADGSRPKGEMSRCRARAPRRMGHGSPDSEVPWPLSFLSQGHPNHANTTTYTGTCHKNLHLRYSPPSSFPHFGFLESSLAVKHRHPRSRPNTLTISQGLFKAGSWGYHPIADPTN